MIGVLNYLGVKAQERRSVIFLLIGFFVVGNAVWLFMRPELFELKKSRADNSAKNKSIPVQHEFRGDGFIDEWRLTPKEQLILRALYKALTLSAPQAKEALEEYQDNDLPDTGIAARMEALTLKDRAELKDLYQGYLAEIKGMEALTTEDSPKLKALYQDSWNNAKKLSFNQFLDEIRGVAWNDAKKLSFNEFAMKTHLRREKANLKMLRGLEDVKFATDGSHAQKLMELVEKKARRSGLSITRSRGSQANTRSKEEFEEYKRTISFSSGLIELVDFLKNVSEEQSMIRVSDMKILPTPDKRQLKVDLTFVASFPKPETEPKSGKASKKKGK
ncbi:MAG: hypothetical protein QF685_01305 [Verrucomicrobiota bacterium]|jgi:hypothetical protein|nr:hypothetical protein [Verrucomicrobiota bacterium]